MAEFNHVIERSKFSKYITRKQVNRFKIIALKFLKQTKDGTVTSIVRDENDNYLLGICENGKADFMITGDQDILVLDKYQKTKIITMGRFIEELVNNIQ